MSASSEYRPPVPEGMTSAHLRKMADWFDTYDQMTVRFIVLTRSAVQQKTAAAALVAVRGDGIQQDLRRWADDMDAASPSGDVS